MKSEDGFSMAHNAREQVRNIPVEKKPLCERRDPEILKEVFSRGNERTLQSSMKK